MEKHHPFTRYDKDEGQGSGASKDMPNFTDLVDAYGENGRSTPADVVDVDITP